MSPYAALVRGRDGNFYGTTQGGGPAEQGSIFVMTPAGGVTTLHTFGATSGTTYNNTINTDGASPTASLVQGSDGNFYGTAQTGGFHGDGTVFSITPGGTLTTLHSFNYGDGAYPTSALLQTSDGNFYGVTQSGGSYGYGTVFVLSSTDALTTLFNFTGAEGLRPQAALIQGSDGNFYGTASQGGPNAGGTVFMITPAGSLTVLHSFMGQASDGANPLATLIQGQDGNFYGTTSRGGSSDLGTVFMITPRGVTTILYTFTGSQDGLFPNSSLLQASDGTLYGTTTNTAFKITPRGQFTALANLGGYNSGPDQPGSGLIVGSDGNFYGALSFTFANSGGVVYQITPAGLFSTLHVFGRSGSEGDSVQSKLALGNDGKFYGITPRGGESGEGTVFAMTPAGALNTLYHFGAGNTGYAPKAGLIQARDGRFYGTTFYGGGNSGTVFSITSGGTLTTFSSFAYDGSAGAYPQAALVQGSDGNFYGTTFAGGTGGNGTVFALDPGGAQTNLHNFSGSDLGGSSDGSSPAAALTQGSDGQFYGVTSSGGSAGQGTVFVVSPTGAFNTLHSFSGNLSNDTGGTGDGAAPDTELVQGRDGSFYGTTSQGGDYTYGTVFVITPAGALKILHSFGGTGSEGAFPNAGLDQGNDGNFYGTTDGGGTFADGTAFMITPDGVLTTIYNFSGRDGIGPSSTLIQTGDGSFYGTTSAGGLYDLGTIYRLTPGGNSTAVPPSPDAQITCVRPGSVAQNDNGDAFILTVTNVGNIDTSGTVTVTVTPGQGLSIAAMSGPGWTCVAAGGNGGDWLCTRADALASGHYYPMLTALVNVSPSATTAQGGSFTSHVTATGDRDSANDYSLDTFTINPAPSTPTQQWRYQYFRTTANSGNAADDANPAGDGITNLLKYALGLDPTVAEVSPITVDTGTGYLRLTAPKNANATDVTYAVQVTGDLTDPARWTTDGTIIVQNTSTLLQVRDTIPIRGTARRFIRLKISR